MISAEHRGSLFSNESDFRDFMCKQDLVALGASRRESTSTPAAGEHLQIQLPSQHKLCIFSHP